jgi:hypothetical protein
MPLSSEHEQSPALFEPGHHVHRGPGPADQISQGAATAVREAVGVEEAVGRRLLARFEAHAFPLGDLFPDDQHVGRRKLERRSL